MSTKVSDFLHELIHSLTKSEKRYFKLLSTRHTIGEVNNYIVLFDYISKQENYDEERLRSHFKGNTFLNKFSITKKRLYDHILSALDLFHSQDNIESQLFKMVHSAEVLCQKSLDNHAKKILISAEKLATKHEQFSILQLIREKSKVLIEKNNYLDITPEEISAIREKDLQLVNTTDNESKLWNLKSLLFQHMAFHGVARNDEEKSEFKKFHSTLLENPIDKNTTLNAKYLWHHIQSAYYFSVGEIEKSRQALETNLQLFQNNPPLLSKHPDRYFSILSNLIYAANSLYQIDLSAQYLKILRDFEHDFATGLMDISLKVKLFSTLASLELASDTQRGDYKLAIGKVEEIEKGIAEHFDRISAIRKAYLYFKISTIHLANNRPSDALKTIRKILNDPELDKKEDIVSFAHILELLIHIELEDLDYLVHACRTTKRFLSSRGRLFEFEKRLISFASKYNSISDKKDGPERWTLLHQSLLKISENTFEATALEYFDFIIWAESKAENKSFIDLSKSKFMTKIPKAA